MIFWKRLWLHGLQQKGVPMFDEESLRKIDSTYFNIILADDRDVTIQSRNTGHYWYLHCAGYPTEQALVIFHKHRFNHPYHQHKNDRAYASERGYGAKWQRERKKFLDSNPFCVKCYEEGHITIATVVDHIKPHRGDQKLFWDRGNWQPLCEHHHNVKTMTEDRYVEYKF